MYKGLLTLLLMTTYISIIYTAVYLAVVIPTVILMSGIKMNDKSVVDVYKRQL